MAPKRKARPSVRSGTAHGGWASQPRVSSAGSIPHAGQGAAGGASSRNRYPRSRRTSERSRSAESSTSAASSHARFTPAKRPKRIITGSETSMAPSPLTSPRRKSSPPAAGKAAATQIRNPPTMVHLLPAPVQSDGDLPDRPTYLRRQRQPYAGNG